jgi:hypothetical protein
MRPIRNAVRRRFADQQCGVARAFNAPKGLRFQPSAKKFHYGATRFVCIILKELNIL